MLDRTKKTARNHPWPVFIFQKESAVFSFRSLVGYGQQLHLFILGKNRTLHSFLNLRLEAIIIPGSSNCCSCEFL